VMNHVAKDEKKLLETCTLPLTGKGVVDLLITDYGVFTFDPLTLTEIADDLTVEQVQAATGAKFAVSPSLKKLPLDG